MSPLKYVWFLPALSVIGLIGWRFPVSAEERLRFDQPTQGEIDWQDEFWQTFVLKVPDDVIAVTLSLEDAPVDLDLYVRRGKPMQDYAEADYYASTFDFNDVLRISRYDYPPLESDRYYIDVAYNLTIDPTVGKERLETIPFTLLATAIRARVDGQLTPNQRISSETNEEDGFFRTFEIEVPRNAEVLRLDLDEVSHDMDLYARRSQQIISAADADHESLALLGRETLIIDQQSQPPLTPGTWYINVLDPYQLGTIPFAIYARFDTDPPETLLQIPTFEAPDNSLEQAIQANVEITGYDGAGSGTLLSADGLILTNYHVVESPAGGVLADGELVISITLDPRQPPRELFRGRVIASDEDLDLALVDITSGFYHQPLPPNYPFPFLELGDPDQMQIGSPISILGFPAAGGTGSRTSVTFTQGVVSGFESSLIGTLIKTDAEISRGNSGGSALDSTFRLIGVPTFVVPELDGNAQIGYVHPVNLLPADWRQQIQERQR